MLNDGLIEGVRALADGGVLVLISDGMDENSATTLEEAFMAATGRTFEAEVEEDDEDREVFA